MKIGTLHEYQDRFLNLIPEVGGKIKIEIFSVLNLAPGLEDIWVMEV
jgi:hypothetical protein